MKEKIKNIIIIVSAFYTIAVSILLLSNLLLSPRTRDLSYDHELNDPLFNDINTRINNLSEGECKIALNESIKNYQKTIYEGEKSIRETYENEKENSFLIGFTNSLTKCDIQPLSTNEKQTNSELTKLITLSQTEYKDFFHPYEIHILDFNGRQTISVNDCNLQYNAKKQTELSILDKTVSIVEERNNENEEQ